MEDWMIALILVALATAIIVYLVRAKKRGETCIGCPHSKQCGSTGGNCASKTDHR